MPRSTISTKGQVTIPLEVRKRLGLRIGDRVEFVFEGGKTVLRPARAQDNPFLNDVGVLPAFNSVEEINRWVDDLRKDDG
jgi:AbrB family looped-hinge helix DNA binding protein